jgi:hypothetical protein
VTNLRDRLQLREQVGQLTALLKAEQQLRAQDRGKNYAQGREPKERRANQRTWRLAHWRRAGAGNSLGNR